MKKLLVFIFGLLLTASMESAHAATIYWTDWTTTGLNVVEGVMDVDGTAVTVTYEGRYGFAQTTDTGAEENYWEPSSPYLSAEVDNAPPAYDIVALSPGTEAGKFKTITFSQVVHDPLIALVSWNGNTVDFGVPIEVLSYGAGYFGNGTPLVNAGSTGFYGEYEVHGVIRLLGDYSSISFTDSSENWHGFTVGVASLPVPEPASLMLIGTGLAGLAIRKRA